MRRRHNRRRKNNQRKIIILSIIGLLFIMAVGYSAFQTNLNINVKGNIVERSRVIQSWTSSSNEDFHTDYYKENIVSATFLDSNSVPSDAIESWDVSASQDKGVMAYVMVNADDNTKYDLYIGANKGVIANEDSRYLFYYFTDLTSIDFNNNFDTSSVINMSGMFAGGNSLTTIDVSSFDTSNVTNMKGMFTAWNYATSNNAWGNRTITSIVGLENFDISNVTDMGDMFSGQPLISLNLTNFDTGNVIDMFHMFNECTELTELNLCSWDTRNTKYMNMIFGNTSSLTKIYVGPNWSTELASNSYRVISSNGSTQVGNYGMFTGSGVSSVTTGEC